MAYDPAKHHRRSVRLKGFDYRSGGAYFITICTHNRECVFGSIENETMKLSQRGLIVQRCWDDIVNHRDNVELDAFQIMPNHIHGVMWLVGATLASPSVDQPHGLQSGSLGAIIGGFKSAVTREINRIRPGVAAHLWQPSFYEHVIRHERALDTIRDYIITNPERWELDAENPVGNGRDDFRLFLRENDVTLISKQGDASVAPTRERDV